MFGELRIFLMSTMGRSAKGLCGTNQVQPATQSMWMSSEFPEILVSRCILFEAKKGRNISKTPTQIWD